MTEPGRGVIRIRGLNKRFGSTHAVIDVDLDIRRGEVLALMGANGAGKSTLIKILCGVHPADSGTVEIDGAAVDFRSPLEACAAGIHTVHQIINDGVVQQLTVAENLALDEICRPDGPLLLSRAAITARARDIQAILGLDLPLGKAMSELGQAERQLVAIARALSHDPKVLILDEPTSSLSEAEAARLFALIEDLRARGVAIVYISHRMSDIRRLADRAVVMRDGRTRAEFVRPLDFDGIVHAMVGHRVGEGGRERGTAGGRTVVEIRDFALTPTSAPFDLDLREGEVVVLTGLIGAGRTEFADCLFGTAAPHAGTVTIDGKPFRAASPREAIAEGVFMAHEDRGNSSLVAEFSVLHNMTLPFLRHFSRLSLVSPDDERRAAGGQVADLAIKCPSVDVPIGSLSGGNQQKVVLGRWLIRPCRLLILDEPFQGVDIGARQDIGRRLRDTAAGRATLVICADLEEATEIADRILVMRDFSVVGGHSIDGLSLDALVAEISGAGTHATFA
ncbi:sugar ABC transporter ATP-binding protein [Pleomorphomonas koreensis]|uniref:sugar ABC transporter ATP-binding protein n=1 Tax=Pleomorphomonas koreensis TaxID=257440 RepID=UPI00047A1933|nr:sugar ABC transporter ATP-binding protein [Pleomorphomonas koreensis]